MKDIEIFRKYLDLIQSDVIKRFTIFSLENAPNYFWTLPASTSGRRHGGKGETLIDHILGCLYLGQCVLEQFEHHWTQRQKDQFISGIILHDLFRCHSANGKVAKFTKEDVEKRGYSEELIDKHRTTRDHAEGGYRKLLGLSIRFNLESRQNKQNEIGARDLNIILKAVRYHYGPFLEIKEKPFCLSWPYDSVVMQVHNVDYMQAINARFFKQLGGKNES